MTKFFLTPFLIAFYTFSALAQEKEGFSASVNVSATVIESSIELITVNAMTFERLQPGQKEISINPVNNSNAGYMIAIGTPDTPFRLSFIPQLVLTNTSGGRSLTFIYQISGGTSSEQTASELLEANNREIRFNNEGNYYLWVGGSINLENADPGNYEGEFSIEIDYI